MANFAGTCTSDNKGLLLLLLLLLLYDTVISILVTEYFASILKGA